MGEVTVAKGYDPWYYGGAVGTKYYLGGEEPAGQWYGVGAKVLGLDGEVDGKVMEGLYHYDTKPDGTQLDTRQRKPRYSNKTLQERVDDAVAKRVKELGTWADPEDIRKIKFQEYQKLRRNVPFYDVTWSAEKSVSLLFAGLMAAALKARNEGNEQEADQLTQQARAIEAASLAAARSTFDYAEEHAAYVRTGHHSSTTGAYRDAEGFVGALFLQHTSRSDDPQLHVHMAVLNRGQRLDKADSRDTKWRALHGRPLWNERLAMGARATLLHGQTLARQGYALVKREDGHGFEIAGISQDTMDQFSGRAKRIAKELTKRLHLFEQRYGRPPSRAELHEIRKQVTLDTRKAKHKSGNPAAEAETVELARWQQRSIDANVQSLEHLPEAARAAAGGGGGGA
jgi:conjugative relaxase-like TrwC/TraI family protein